MYETFDEKIVILRQLLPSMADHGGYWTALCPAHEDTNPSLSINKGDKGPDTVLLKCHKGCSVGEITTAIGLSPAWLCSNEEKLSAAKGRSQQNDSGALKDWGLPVATYQYFDEDGVELFQSCKFEKWNPETDKKEKRFSQRRKLPDGKWTYSLGKDTRKVLYRLPELLSAPAAEPVYVVEGEKDVETLRTWGFTATCNPMGAGKWLKAYSKFLKGRDVVILPDNDEPGEKHAKQVAESLAEFAKSIIVVRLPNLPPKGDVTDWKDAGGTAQGLVELCKIQPDSAIVTQGQADAVRTAVAHRASLDRDDMILAALNITVIGEDESAHIEIWSGSLRKKAVVKDIDRLTVAKLLQICGPSARNVIHRGDASTTPDPGFYRITEIREAIATVAGKTPLTERQRLGVGIWEVRCESESDALHGVAPFESADDIFGDTDSEKVDAEPTEGDTFDTSAVVLVNSKSATILNGQPKPYVHGIPIYRGAMLDMSAPEEWFSHAQMEPLLVAAKDVGWRRDVYMQAYELYSRWLYSMDGAVGPQIVTGLILGTLVQSWWKWRPLVSVIGKSQAGKSTFFSTLCGNQASGTLGMFGHLAFYSTDITAAAITQSMMNRSMFLILDELERSKHREEILNLLRGSGSGGTKVRGSAAHKAKAFGLRHIVWTGATENGINKEPDRNRWITVEFVKPASQNQGKLSVPSDIELQELGRKMIAVAAHSVHSAKAMARKMEQECKQSEIRIVQSYSVPAAMTAAACGYDFSTAMTILENMLGTFDADIELQSDESRLIEFILNHQIFDDSVGERSKYTVAELITRNERQLLARHGIHILDKGDRGTDEHQFGNNEKCIFFSTEAMRQHVFKDNDDWRGMNAMQLLVRLGGQKVRCRAQGTQQRGVLVPYQNVITPIEEQPKSLLEEWT